MSEKDLKINFRYLIGNIACMSVDNVSGKQVHNDINDEEAIILFNSLVGEKENCKTVKKLLEENQQLKEQNEKEFADYTKFKQEQYDEYLDKTNKLIKERQHYKQQLDLYKSVVDEIRDILENNFLEDSLINTATKEEYVCLSVKDYKKAKEILDKVNKGIDKE